MKNQEKILLIEDDPSLQQLLVTMLGHHTYQVNVCDQGKDGVEFLRNQPFDLVILDLGLPDCDGQDIIKMIRNWASIPIMVLSARNQEPDIMRALDNGADDYLTKPFSNGELIARIRALLRRSIVVSSQELKTYKTGDFIIEIAKRRVFVGENEIHLTPIEFRLLAELAHHAGFVVTRRQLLEKVWGGNYVEHDHYLRIHMGQIRHKIEKNPARPRYLITEAGVGYRLSDEGS